MNDKDFTELEKTNVKWDIWIDLEAYGKFKKLVPEEFIRRAVEAFSGFHCARTIEVQRGLFGDNEPPDIASRVLGKKNDEGQDRYTTAWNHLLWAKYVRSKIQERGTDCYYSKLDQQIAYLERHLPVVSRGDEQSNKLAVLYLLEMAAAGSGPDQRSFAERARRILRDFFGREDPFFKFYDLLARYNSGVGYQHEGQKRLAVLEFNYVIFELDKIYNSQEDIDEEWKEYAKERRALELMHIPSLLMRAGIQLKLQLAYHTLETLEKILDILPSRREDLECEDYVRAKTNLLEAEAHRLRHDLDRSKKCLETVEEFLVRPGNYPNIRGRHIDTLVALELDQLKDGKNKDTHKKIIESLQQHLKRYWNEARYSATNREGYLLVTAEILAELAGRSDKFCEEIYKKIYDDNKEGLLEREEFNKNECEYCKRKGIDLRKISSKHYEEFRKHMLKFFRSYRDQEKISVDKKEFAERLLDIEKQREDLEWRRREIEYLSDSQNKPHSSWCENCLPLDSSSKGFQGLLACDKAGERKNSNDEQRLTDYDYEHIMDTWDKRFLEHLKWRTVHERKGDALHFLGLQRWNSASPAQGKSVGGGYFLYKTNDRGEVEFGIAIDPGFDFVRNLFHEGFSLSDIDLVLLSHAHIDHIRDFESMVVLYSELDKREKEKRRPHVIMTLGIYRRLAHIIENPGLRKYIEPYIIDIEKEIEGKYIEKQKFKFKKAKESVFGNNLTAVSRGGDWQVLIKPVLAYHNDFSEYSDSFGFRIEIESREEDPFRFGYTGDTSWHHSITEKFKECDAVLVHLGSLIDREKEERRKFSYYEDENKCWEMAVEKNHPYLFGMLHLIKELTKAEKPLILMSEFGEELRGRIRLDLIRRFRGTFGHEMIMPVDVGLDVKLCDFESGGRMQKALCVICDEFVPLDRLDFETYGHDEALFCVCTTCKKSTPTNVLQEKLKGLYEVGRTPQKAYEAGEKAEAQK